MLHYAILSVDSKLKMQRNSQPSPEAHIMLIDYGKTKTEQLCTAYELFWQKETTIQEKKILFKKIDHAYGQVSQIPKEKPVLGTILYITATNHEQPTSERRHRLVDYVNRRPNNPTRMSRAASMLHQVKIGRALHVTDGILRGRQKILNPEHFIVAAT